MQNRIYKIHLSKRGQTVIPKDLRKQLGYNFNIVFDENLKKWVVVNMDELIDNMVGILSTGSSAQSLKDEIRQEELQKLR